jgi:hypothetical protein
MPITTKGREIKAALVKEYGPKKGEQILFAGKNKGTFTGIDAAKATRDSSHPDHSRAYMDAVSRGDAEAIRACGDAMTRKPR